MVSPLLSNTLPIAEVFTSPQGDGTPTTFVRLAGPSDQNYHDLTLFKIASFIPPQIRHVWITGGEAIKHREPLGLLLAALTFDKKTIHLENSGTTDPPDYWKNNEHIWWEFQSSAVR